MQNNVLDYLDCALTRCPDKIAFSDGKEELTFYELDKTSRTLATYLAKKGIYKEPVVVFMRKSPHEIAAFFGIIRAGNFYVPIDSEMPRARIEKILENVKPRLILCDEETLGEARQFDFALETLIWPESPDAGIDEEALSDIYEKSIDTDPVYIVFTSGSTGVPKGVAACHRSVIDYIEQLSEVLGFDGDTVFGNQAPLYFDACLKELYPTLKFGATTYLIPRELFSMPVRLIEFLNEHKINTICWVVSALTMISAFDTFRVVTPRYLRTVAFGSEVFPVKQFNRWKTALPNADFVNLYGPTEGTGMCCYYRVSRDFSENDVIPVGRPFKNTEILLLTPDGNKAAPGQEGEICIRGTCVTLGYYNDPLRTAEAFVQNPLNHAYQETIYRTGDIGRINDRGELVFVSRRDWQVKHMGHRIELGEIEAAIVTIPAVRMAACVYDNVSGRIAAFYAGDCDEKELLAGLKAKLPRYMLPNRIKHLPGLPFTANGKIDRKALLCYL